MKRLLGLLPVLGALTLVIAPYVWACNLYPYALFDEDDELEVTVATGVELDFDACGEDYGYRATGSYDPDYEGAGGGGFGIEWYYFYFGEGGSDDNWWGTAPHTYTTPGVYEASVWVVDDDSWGSLDPGLRQVTVVGVGDVNVYAGGKWNEAVGSTIVVLKGTKYTFKAVPNPSGANWPSGTPNWSGVASGTGETIEVTFDSAGTKTLTAKCGSADTGKTVTINVVEPIIYQFGVGGDHTLYKTPPDDAQHWGGWGDADANTPITDPVYDVNLARNDAFCASANTSISLTDVVLHVPSALSYTTTIRIDANSAPNDDWNPSGEVSFSGTSSTSTGLGMADTICTDGKVRLYHWSYYIQWRYKVPNGTDTWYSASQTSHMVFVTFATPEPGGSESTEKRLHQVCDWAHGYLGEYDVVWIIHSFLAASGLFNYAGDQSDDWDLMWNQSGKKGDCDNLARFMIKCLDMIGATGGNERLVRASTDAGAGNCLDQESNWHGLIQWLVLDFDTGSGYNWNAWEGCCEAGGAYWAVYPKHEATDDYDMLKNHLSCQQYWVTTVDNVEPGEGYWGVEEVLEEEPIP